MDNNELATSPFSAGDEALLRKLKEKAWFTFLRLYLPLFLFLVYIHFRMAPGGIFRGHTIKYSRSQFETVYPFFAVFFASIFLFFAIKDFKRLILPYQKETRSGKKYSCMFTARKYHDILYGKCLLFYPDRDDLYIEIAPEDFEAISNGDELYLETGCITGEVLSLKSAGRVFKNPEEFSFSDR